MVKIKQWLFTGSYPSAWIGFYMCADKEDKNFPDTASVLYFPKGASETASPTSQLKSKHKQTMKCWIRALVSGLAPPHLIDLSCWSESAFPWDQQIHQLAAARFNWLHWSLTAQTPPIALIDKRIDKNHPCHPCSSPCPCSVYERQCPPWCIHEKNPRSGWARMRSSSTPRSSCRAWSRCAVNTPSSSTRCWTVPSHLWPRRNLGCSARVWRPLSWAWERHRWETVVVQNARKVNLIPATI